MSDHRGMADWLRTEAEMSSDPDSANGYRRAARMIERLALAAGTQSAETNEDLAQSEGCQSGPKGNAQTIASRNPK